MRHLLVFLAPGLLTSCVLVPFFLEPQSTDDTAPWWSRPDPIGPDDTGEPPDDVFDAYAVFVDAQVVVQDGQVGGYYLFEDDPNSWQDPFVTFMFVEQEYFNSYNARYACTWTGTAEVVEPTDLYWDTIWYAWEIELTLVQTNCEGFDLLEWGESTPTTRLEELHMAIGYAEMSQEMRDSFRDAIRSWGYDWADFEPYVFSTWMGFSATSGDWYTEEVDYTVALGLDPDGGLLYGTNGDALQIPLAEQLPPQGLYTSYAWMGFLASTLSDPP